MVLQRSVFQRVVVVEHNGRFVFRLRFRPFHLNGQVQSGKLESGFRAGAGFKLRIVFHVACFPSQMVGLQSVFRRIEHNGKRAAPSVSENFPLGIACDNINIVAI